MSMKIYKEEVKESKGLYLLLVRDEYIFDKSLKLTKKKEYDFKNAKWLSLLDLMKFTMFFKDFEVLKASKKTIEILSGDFEV